MITLTDCQNMAVLKIKIVMQLYKLDDNLLFTSHLNIVNMNDHIFSKIETFQDMTLEASQTRKITGGLFDKINNQHLSHQY